MKILTGLKDEEIIEISHQIRHEHFGMKLDRVRNCGERFHMYDLIREVSAN